MNNLTVLKRPPDPARETARIRQGLSVRVDAGLVTAFRETGKQLGLTPSQLMETILWNALGQPLMSFDPKFDRSRFEGG